MKNINAIIIQKIIDSIPPNMKLAEFLMDKLGLCKESAYRRIRGDVAFTIEQIMHVSLELGFSIDELVAHKNNDYILY
ncbi:MAG: helix-turn-helix domain-containing protein, partial [Dysgonomonas sp.]